MNFGTENKPKAEALVEDTLDEFSLGETEKLIGDFRESFDSCVRSCEKPNILISGITGSGKSSLVNGIFGLKVATAGVGVPVTQHFEKFSPDGKPVVIFDSKGLEWNEHEAFIKETTEFFNSLRQKEVKDQIHCVWYVINAGRGRVEPFELKLVNEVFAPTPVIFILNKADLADASQIKELKKVLKSEAKKGIFVTVSNRGVWTQGWCPKCGCDDVVYDEETKELECLECETVTVMEETYGLEEVVKVTLDLLPELAKDAFAYCQEISRKQKDERAKRIVIDAVEKFSLDVKGSFISSVAQMCAKLFVVWGYPLTGDKFRDEIAKVQAEYVKSIQLKERLLISSLDFLFQKKISKVFASILGLTMNSGLRKLNTQLIEAAKEGAKGIDEINLDDFMKNVDIDLDEDTLVLFFEMVFFKGVDLAINTFWNIDKEKIEELKKESKLMARMQPNEGEEEVFEMFQRLQLREGNQNDIVMRLNDNGDVIMMKDKLMDSRFEELDEPELD